MGRLPRDTRPLPEKATVHHGKLRRTMFAMPAAHITLTCLLCIPRLPSGATTLHTDKLAQAHKLIASCGQRADIYYAACRHLLCSDCVPRIANFGGHRADQQHYDWLHAAQTRLCPPQTILQRTRSSQSSSITEKKIVTTNPSQ